MIASRPILLSTLLVGLVLSPLLFGIEPVGRDADFMYRPIKQVLSESLGRGELPFWSDLFGVGEPLVAESHAAAFYPPNWLLYRAFPVPLAYRLGLWLHGAALAAATCAYARRLGFSPPGSVASAVGFALCGFQAAHSVHEPFVALMPYLPLCLLLADAYVSTGRRSWLAALALAWGVQITCGHFQIQMWTAGLVLLTGWWRIRTGGFPRSRGLKLLGGLFWGAAIASVQLGLTWELTRIASFNRPPKALASFLFPPSHWAQWALPIFYVGNDDPSGGDYWLKLGTTPEEACAYGGILPLLLASIGLFAPCGDRRLVPWLALFPLAFALATLPRWWPSGFALVARLPGLGWFRAPARYILLCNLGLALLAGRGLDRSIPWKRFRLGLAVALAFGIAAWLWSFLIARDPAFLANYGAKTLARRSGISLLEWGFALAVLLAWRLGKLGDRALLGAIVLELAALFYASPIPWQRSVRIPEESPILARLLSEPRPGLVAGPLQNLPVRVGRTTAFATLGITAPPPNYILESSLLPPGKLTSSQVRWHRRFGVTHGIWSEGDDVRGTEVIADLPDPALERLSAASLGFHRSRRWKLVRYADPFPPAWIALRGREVPSWKPLFGNLSREDFRDEAWFDNGDDPPETRTDVDPSAVVTSGPRPRRHVGIYHGTTARSARVLDWDGRSGRVEHDGTCYLLIRRAHYPGWTYRLDDGPPRPILRASGGLQCVLLPVLNEGDSPPLRTTRVSLSYHPTGLVFFSSVSLLSLASALVVLGLGWSSRRVP